MKIVTKIRIKEEEAAAEEKETNKLIFFHFVSSYKSLGQHYSRNNICLLTAAYDKETVDMFINQLYPIYHHYYHAHKFLTLLFCRYHFSIGSGNVDDYYGNDNMRSEEEAAAVYRIVAGSLQF